MLFNLLKIGGPRNPSSFAPLQRLSVANLSVPEEGTTQANCLPSQTLFLLDENMWVATRLIKECVKNELSGLHPQKKR